MLPASLVQRLLLGKCLGLLPVLYTVQLPNIIRATRLLSSNTYNASRHIANNARVQPLAASRASSATLAHAAGATAVVPGSRLPYGYPNTGCGSSTEDVISWLGFAAAAAVAALGATAAADAHADSDKVRQGALSSAELAVSEAFQEVLLDWDRATAQQQQPGSSSSLPSNTPRPQHPKVQLDGQFITVTIPILPAADVAGILRQIDRSLDQLALHGSSSSSQQQQTRLLGTSKVVQWDLSRTVQSPPSVKQSKGHHSTGSSASGSSSREQLKVQVVLPLQPGGSPHERSGSSSSPSSSSSAQDPTGNGNAVNPASTSYGYVSVVKPNSAFTADELALLARLVAAANKPGSGNSSNSSGYYSEDSWLGPFGLPGSSSSSFGGLPGPLGGALGGLADSLLNKVFGDLVHEIFDELDIDVNNPGRQFQQHFHDLEQQLKGSVPPEVIQWLQDFQQQQQQQQQQQSGSELTEDSLPDSSATAAAASAEATTTQQQQQQQQLPWQTPAARAAAQQLQQLGAQVYFPAATALAQQQQHQQQQQGDSVDPPSDEGWGALAGYEEQKQALEDFLLLPLKHPEVFDRVASRTRKLKSSGGSRPRAVLFEGPPGTGKTSSARLLSRRAALPLVYVPLEALVSKWYGESEQNLAKLFKACEALGGCIIFLDELDSLATSRDRSDMHEASRRLLGVLLREIDGFDNTLGSDSSSGGAVTTAAKASSSGSSRRSVLIGATNRRQDLDAALLSRFDLSIHFGLPDEQCRAAILQQYANHLDTQELSRLAEKTSGFSGRDLRDICEQTERQWASRIIRGEVDAEQLPGVDDYLANVRQRKQGAGASGRGGVGGFPWINGGPGLPGQYRT